MGTSHMLSKDEAKFVFEKGCEQLIVGSGQIGNVRLSPEAESYFARKDCKVLLQRTPEARSRCLTGHVQHNMGDSAMSWESNKLATTSVRCRVRRWTQVACAEMARVADSGQRRH